MLQFTDEHLEALVAQSYARAHARHSDLGLAPEAFSTHLHSIIRKHLGSNPPHSAALDFVAMLHLDDLYLTFACAQGSEAAWGRFAVSYGGYIRRVSECACSSKDLARDLADSVLGHIFLPDSTGRSRMASYAGLSPLAAWLAVVIKHHAEHERRLKSNNLESIDRMPDLSDQTSILKVEATIRAGKYERPIKDSLQCALSLLSERERTMLRLRYEQQLQVRQVARLFGVKPPAISRQLDRTREKLREHVISILSTKHRLGPAVIQDCLADIVENPEHSILALR
jgi:RNA polymerase sigma-70 factor, ECF subfamily